MVIGGECLYNGMVVKHTYYVNLAELGFKEPTPIQRQVIPVLLSLGFKEPTPIQRQAIPGSGEMLAFLCQILMKIKGPGMESNL
ncbi:uncharacterized protein A4U43_C05F30870 [Asparagus officinalis]|uniref:DEAD-box RNA helicase Q domain-containing protein n=1 Tax=Asparagus officinalis TaxID=4686 RepID=A0A5P1EVP9_ASPOF|nr:uncharacterized protein A4U43_C05F30870 [Asparagus officinalis]